MTNQERTEEILDVFQEAFGTLIEANPKALRGKFRKMASSAFAFYRGSACLFYHDFPTMGEGFLDDKTSRVWIQGDLHAQNYGTYMSAEGILVFDVNDYDESYVGPFTADVLRMGASLFLLGLDNAQSDEEIANLIGTYARAYANQVHRFATTDNDDQFALRLDNTTGPLHEVLQDARMGTRVALLDRDTVVENHERVFKDGPGVRSLDENEKAKVVAAFEKYVSTIPEAKRRPLNEYHVKDVVGRSGFGIGSAGLPAFNILLEGHTQALENDVILSMKQANVSAVSRLVTDERIASYFENSGHRTVLSQRALQAHSDPWLGYTDIDGKGQLVAELSPYEADLDWKDLGDPKDAQPVLELLGAATAKIHCVADASADQTLVPFVTEAAIDAAIQKGGGVEAFVNYVVETSVRYGMQARVDHGLFVDALRNGHVKGLA